MSKNLSKRVVGASVLAVAVAMSGSAYAVANLGVAGFPATSLAVELNYNNAASASPAGTAVSTPVIQTPAQAGISVGQNRFLRFTIAGATIHGPNAGSTATLTGALLTDVTTPANFSAVTVLNGGTSGSSCVSFEVTGNGSLQSDLVQLGSFAVDVPPGNTAPVVMTYNMYDTPTAGTCAAAPGTPLGTDVSGPVVTFGNSLAFGTVPNTNTADVQAVPPFSLFLGSASAIQVGGVYFALSSPTTINGATGLPVTIGALISKAVLTVAPSTGSGADFSQSVKTGNAFTGVDLNGTAATTETANLATFNLGTSAVGAAPVGAGAPVTLPIDYTVTGNAAIGAGDYTASVALTAQPAAVNLETLQPATLGTIKHNGTTLETPWFTIFPGYTSRIVITNRGTTDAPYKSTVITETGVTSTAGSLANGTVKANSTLVIDASSIASAFSAGTRGSLIINLAAPNQYIDGEYQSINASNGSIDTYNLQQVQ